MSRKFIRGVAYVLSNVASVAATTVIFDKVYEATESLKAAGVAGFTGGVAVNVAGYAAIGKFLGDKMVGDEESDITSEPVAMEIVNQPSKHTTKDLLNKIFGDPILIGEECSVNDEDLRDFCGSFCDLAKTSRNASLMYRLPESIWAYCSAEHPDLEKDDLQKVAHEMMQEVVSNLLVDYRTKNAFCSWINNPDSLKTITPLEIAYLCDAIYIDMLPVDVEMDATQHLLCNSPVILSPEEQEVYDHTADYNRE